MGLIYVVEDDRDISEIESFALKNSGYDVQVYENGADFYRAVRERVPCLVLLDIMLPDESGLAVTKKLREDPRTRQVPIILVTAKTTELDKVRGLDMGADDYVAKPYNPQELAARVKSQLRRYTCLGDIHAGSRIGEIRNGRLLYRTDEKMLYADGEPVKLTAKETGIIDLLMRNPGRVYPAEEIYRRVWEEDAFASENTVMVHIRRIREKLELNPKEPEYIKVVWGIGYKMEKH